MRSAGRAAGVSAAPGSLSTKPRPRGEGGAGASGSRKNRAYSTRPMANIPVSGQAHDEAPLLVLGRRGQLATDLVEAGARLGTALIALGRPELELTEPGTIARALDRH